MRYNMINDQLMQFHGNKARFDVGRESYALYPESNAIEMETSVEKKQPGSFSSAAPQHIRNFMECIRSRKDPNAPVEAGTGNEYFTLHGDGFSSRRSPVEVESTSAKSGVLIT